MNNINQLLNNVISGGSGAFNRRAFLETAGKGILATTAIAELASCTAEAQSVSNGPVKSISDTISVRPVTQHAPSEQQQATGVSVLPKDKRIGYALVGLGELTLGQILPQIGSSKYSKPVALVSGDPVKAKKVAAQYGIPEKNIYDYKNFDNIKSNPEIDAVYIVLPNSMHEEFVVRAAKAGKHVLCEKPMATSVKAAQNMIEACKKAGKKLMIAYRIQYEPHNRMAMEWARSKHFGQVKVISSTNVQNIGRPDQWRLKKALAGGGSLPDIGLYNINTNRFILGEEPHMVTAHINTTPNDPRFKEVEESVMFQMYFPSGAIANNTCSYGAHNSKYYRCFTDNGGWFGLDPAFDYAGLKLQSSQAQGKIEMKQEPVIPEKKQFAIEMDHFAECIMQDKTPYTPGEEGLQDQKIMEAIYESAANNGKPVKLEMITKPDSFRGTPPTED